MNMLKYANRNKPITKQEQEKMIKEREVINDVDKFIESYINE